MFLFKNPLIQSGSCHLLKHETHNNSHEKYHFMRAFCGHSEWHSVIQKKNNPNDWFNLQRKKLP
jgi:hypothetical protein